MSNDTLINADLWDETPKIFTANYAFEGIEGVENMTQAGVEAAGGSWYAGPTCNLTTTQSPSGVSTMWGWPTYYADAMPVVFSWPVKVSTVNGSDFLLTLNTGEQVYPDVASLSPNSEWNERSTVVIFGQFGNRITPGSPGAQYVERVEIVDDGNPLMLVGPGGTLFNAVGLSYDASCCPPYGPDAKGPTLVAAKLSRYSDAGEYSSSNGAVVFPNSCTALYGNDSTVYRLRMYTSGGFSPDGITGMTPDSYSKYFRIHVQTENGTMMLDEAGVEYSLPLANGKTDSLKILGLADLGLVNSSQVEYNLCYIVDADNYIDICMQGTDDAARGIVALEMPAGNRTADPDASYLPVYNPGGPGPTPAPNVNYTNPSPYVYQPVTMALDDPFTVTVYDNGNGQEVNTPSPSATASSANVPKPWSSLVALCVASILMLLS